MGLAIELSEGASISWDGRHISHCTSVPHDVSDGDALYSVFFSVSSKAEQADTRSREMLEAERHRARVGGAQRPFRVGDRVWARWYPCPGSGRWRRASGRIAEVLDAGGVCVAWVGEGTTTQISRAAQGNTLVHAGLVEEPEEAGQGLPLVGQRVRVYWSGEDRIFPGVVKAFDGNLGHHTVAYDDGDIAEGALGDPLGDFPLYFIEE